MSELNASCLHVERELICKMAAQHVIALSLLMVAEEKDPCLPMLQAHAKRAYQDLVKCLRNAGYLALSTEPIHPVPPSDDKHSDSKPKH